MPPGDSVTEKERERKEPDREASSVEPKPTANPSNSPSARSSGAKISTAQGQIWARVLSEVSAGQVRSILQNAQELWEENDRAFLRPTPRFRVSAERQIDKIRDLVRQVAGPGVEVELVAPQTEEVAEAKSNLGGNNEPPSGFKAEDDPLVQRAAEAFGAKIVNVQPKGTGHA